MTFCVVELLFFIQVKALLPDSTRPLPKTRENNYAGMFLISVAEMRFKILNWEPQLHSQGLEGECIQAETKWLPFGRHNFQMKIVLFCFRFHWNLFSKGSINNMPALVQIIAWCRTGMKLLSDSIKANYTLLTHVYASLSLNELTCHLRSYESQLVPYLQVINLAWQFISRWLDMQLSNNRPVLIQVKILLSVSSIQIKNLNSLLLRPVLHDIQC